VAGGALESLDRLDEAAVRLVRAVELAERVGSAEELVGSLINLGVVEGERGRSDKALAAHRRAHAAARAAGNRNGELFASSNIAYVLWQMADPEAATWARRTFELAEATGNAPIAADSIETLARVALAERRYADAIRLAEDAAARFGAIDEREMAEQTRALAAEARAAAGA
jgi:tetratricopeptide (TPR) repeat protein